MDARPSSNMQNRKRVSRFALVVTLLLALCTGMFSPRLEQAVEAMPLAAPATTVVISEFRTRGDTLGNEAVDEFIELYNPTSSTVDISAWLIKSSDNLGVTSTIATIPANTSLLSGQYYLIANTGYTGPTAPTPNLTYGGDIADDGGIALTLSNGTTIVDQVGLSAGSAYVEGTFQTALTTDVDRGYERLLGGNSDSCQDNGDNSSDFQLINPSNPQNLSTTSRLCGKIFGLNITNTVNNPNPTVGSNIIFTIKVDNPAGNPYTASNVNVSALLPAGLTYVSHSVTAGTYTSGTGAWTGLGSIAVGSSATLIITAQVVTSSPPAFTATVTSNEYVDKSASVTLGSLSGQADLAITQSLDTNSGIAGQVSLTITVTNQGTDTATGVEVMDLLPSGLDYVSHTSTLGGYSPISGIWTVGSLANGSFANLVLKVKVASSGSSTNNTAQIWKSNQFDPHPADNSNSLEVPIADLSISQTGDFTASTAIFTITVTNSGPDAASNVEVLSTLPLLTSTYEFVSSSQASFVSSSGLWTVGPLAAGATKTLVLTTNIKPSPLQTHFVEVSKAEASVASGPPPVTVTVGMVDPDSIPNNKVKGEDDYFGLPYADLSLTQTVNNSSPAFNSNIIFTITVINSGPYSMSGVSVQDILPTGLAYVSSTPSSGSYDSATGIWTVGTLASGTNAKLNITAKVTTSGVFVNKSEVWTSDLSDPDSNPGNGATTEDDYATTTATLNPTPTPTGTSIPARSVVINEIAWAGTASTLTDDEWIELYNPTSNNINITGWILKSNTDGTPSIQLVGVIPAGGYFLLEKDDDTVTDERANQIYTGELVNSGERLTLNDPSNNVIDTANNNGGGWPAGSISTYGTMERVTGSVDFDTSWFTNTGVTRNGKNANGGDIRGTPGQPNTVRPTATPRPGTSGSFVPTSTPFIFFGGGGVTIDPRPVINEILPRPGFDWNQDGKGDVFDEFIEIKNLTSISISLSGWSLKKVGSGSFFSLPNISLTPGQRVVFYSKETNLLLSDGGETINLVSPTGQIYDSYTYTIARAEDRSICRMPDTNVFGSWYEDCIPTPEFPNTREGSVPTSADGSGSPVCDLPDTIPLDFFIPECNGYGAAIWNPFYWDFTSWLDKLWVQQVDEKWRTYIE